MFEYQDSFYASDSILKQDGEYVVQSLASVIDEGVQNVEAVEPYAERTVLLVPEFAREWQLPIEKKLLVGLLLCYPFAIVMHLLPYGKIRHVFSFLTGAFILQFTYGRLWIHSLVTSFIVYGLFSLPIPRKYGKLLVNFFVMSYLALLHIHLQYTDYLGYSMGYIGPQMFLTQKLYMMAYNLYDGHILSKTDTNNRNRQASIKCASYALESVPTLVEFLGYTFCFSTILVGPSIEFSIYRDACEGNQFIKNGNKAIKKGKKKKGVPRNIPSNIWPSAKPFLQSVLALWFFSGLRKFKVSQMVDPDVLIQPWSYRYLHMMLAMACLRTNFYFLWKLSEGANNAWFLGFEGFDEKGAVKGWDNSSSANVRICELGGSVSAISKAWNKKVSNWLKRYVYYRYDGSLFITFTVAGIWFGFYPSYYLSVYSFAFLILCERLWAKKVSPHLKAQRFHGSTRFKQASNFIYGVVMLQFTIYFASPFFLRSLENTYLNWKAQNFLGHIFCITFYAVGSLLPTPYQKSHLYADMEKGETDLRRVSSDSSDEDSVSSDNSEDSENSENSENSDSSENTDSSEDEDEEEHDGMSKLMQRFASANKSEKNSKKRKKKNKTTASANDMMSHLLQMYAEQEKSRKTKGGKRKSKGKKKSQGESRSWWPSTV